MKNIYDFKSYKLYIKHTTPQTLTKEQQQFWFSFNMIFTIPKLIEYISGFTELHAGDVIATGTPEGLGFSRKPPRFLKKGDYVEVIIDKIGILRNKVS